jgi:hypothetical protein
MPFDIPISPHEIAVFFGRLPAIGQFMIIAGIALSFGLFVGWMARRTYDRDSISHWRDLVDSYERKAGTFSNSQAIERLLTRIGALPENTLKDADIVGEVREGLEAMRDSEMLFAASVIQSEIEPAPLSRTTSAILIVVISVLFFVIASLVGLIIKSAYDLFPDPLTANQMSALVERLRSEGPQRVQIIRKDDSRCIALAEQLKRVFESAHWVLVMPPQSPNRGVTLARGLIIWYGPDNTHAFALSRALHDSGINPQTGKAIDLTGSGYFELTISDGWFERPPD